MIWLVLYYLVQTKTLMPRCIKETFDYEKTVIKKRLQVETKTRNHTIISFNNMYHNVLFMECFLSFIFTFTSFHLS